MGQVPSDPRYLLVGSGRVARHLHHYFSLLGIFHEQWARRSLQEFNSVDVEEYPYPGDRLKQAVNNCDCVLLAVSDKALEELAANPAFQNKTIVHFSGALNIPGAVGAHPLMTFGPTLYSREEYQCIPFVVSKSGPDFDSVFPDLLNPSFAIAEQDRPLYHSLCVSAGNLPTILLHECLQRFEKDLNLPRELLYPYLKATLNNIIADSDTALTGPLVRGDQKTMTTNQQALSGSPLGNLYEAFVEFYKTRGQQ